MRLYRENIALKAQVLALILELKTKRGKKPRVSVSTRATQVFALLLTRGDKTFEKYYLSASRKTLVNWATKFRRGPWFWRKPKRVGRPPKDQFVKDLIIQLKSENPAWGARRIKNELRRMGITICEPTIQKILKENGFFTTDGTPRNWERFISTAKDTMWALDYFFIRTVKGAWLNVLIVVDIYTREIIELRAFDGWEADSAWTSRTFHEAMVREERKPETVIHDHGVAFKSQFERQLRVLDIEQKRTPTRLPWVNGIAERTIKTARFELLNHIRILDVLELQWYLDEFKRYFNNYRTNQAIGGRTPAEYGRDSPVAEVIDLCDIRQRSLVHHRFAYGLLNAYELVDEAGPSDGQAAA